MLSKKNHWKVIRKKGGHGVVRTEKRKEESGTREKNQYLEVINKRDFKD